MPDSRTRPTGAATLVAWIVLTLVFVDEVLACVAAGVVGASTPAPGLFVWLLPAVVVAVWWAFASPRAPYGGRVVRPTTKVLVFGFAGLGLWLTGHHGASVALLAFSLVAHALARLPIVQATLRSTAPG